MSDEIYTVTIDADGNAVTNLETIEELQEFIDRTIRFTVNANTSDSQNRLRRLKEMLDDIKSKTVTVTTKTESSGTGGGKLSLPTDPKRQMAFTNASGTDFFPGGYSLINEKGPEIVAANGMASIYANGFPTIAKIPRGAQIFNAKDTAAILGNRMSIPAYASGTTPVPVMEWIGQGLKSIGETVSSGISSLSKALSGATKPGGQTTGGVTIPKDPPKEEEKKEEKSSGGSGSSSKSSEKEEEEEDDEFWNTIKEDIDYGLKKIQCQIEDYQNDITAIERARDALLKPIEEELEDLEYSM